MSRGPRSPVVRFRNWLAGKLIAYPAPGEAWCWDCVLNDGRSVVISVEGAMHLARTHAGQYPGACFRMQTSQHPETGEERP